MNVTFQECPGCSCLIPVDDYAELRLPERTVHLMHCRFCKIGETLSVGMNGHTATLKIRGPGDGYTAFVRLLDEVQRGTARRRDEEFKVIRETARAA